MFERLGINWACTLIGFCALLLAPSPFLFYKFGPAIRSRSKFSPCLVSSFFFLTEPQRADVGSAGSRHRERDRCGGGRCRRKSRGEGLGITTLSHSMTRLSPRMFDLYISYPFRTPALFPCISDSAVRRHVTLYPVRPSTYATYYIHRICCLPHRYPFIVLRSIYR